MTSDETETCFVRSGAIEESNAMVAAAVEIDLNGERGDLAPFALLHQLTDNARVAFLVEMDHCIHERHEFRLLLIRYLAERGWRWFGDELDWRQGDAIDTYLHTGDEAFLDPIDDGRWYTSGVLSRYTARAPSAAMHAERQRFARKLRRAVPEARYFGFDVGGGDAEYLREANAATTSEQLLPVMALRERIMHDRVRRVLEEHPHDRVALMAGSTHLMKDDKRVSAPGMTPAGGGTEASVGHYVTDLVNGAVVSIWLLHGGGATASPAVPSGTLQVPDGTINAELAREWQTPCFGLVDDDVDDESQIVQMHNLIMKCRLPDQVDALVFCPTVTPVRETENP